MSSLHDRLAQTLNRYGTPGQVIELNQLQTWYLQAGFRRERLFPAHHARGEKGELPLCARCQSHPLFEKVTVQGRRNPLYRILAQELPDPQASDHDLLAQILQPRQGETETLAKLRKWLISRLNASTPDRLNTAQNLLRHTPQGGCIQCQQMGPLLQRLAREQYQILPQLESKSPIHTLQLTLPEIWQLAQEQGVWDAWEGPLVHWLAEKWGWPLQQSQQELRKLTHSSDYRLRQESPKLVEMLWRSESLSDWQSWHGVYFRHVTQPVRELVFEAFLPDGFVQDQIRVQPLLEEFLNWFLGGRPAYAQELEARLTDLSQRGPLAESLLLELAQGTAQARLRKALQLPGLTNSWPLATGLMALLWPERYMTISPPLLWGLSQLEKSGQIQTGVRSLQLGEMSEADILRLQAWGLKECQRRNKAWGQSWLTPRKLDRCLYALRDFVPESLAQVVKGKQAEAKMMIRSSEVRQLLDRIGLSPSAGALSHLREAAADLRRQTPLPECLRPFLQADSGLAQ